MNFMALAIIAEFDNAFFSALGSENMTDILSNPAYKDLYTIKRTTSYNARRNKQNKLVDPTVPPFLKSELKTFKIDFMDRTYFHMLLRGVYKILRIIQITVWFYFMPFLALIGSYIVPYYFQVKNANACPYESNLG